MKILKTQKKTSGIDFSVIRGATLSRTPNYRRRIVQYLFLYQKLCQNMPGKVPENN
ncbi:MAG: hypothetical protein PF481_11645 [Bacteroidales bacterium]|nr:hypothetical protein [Bacteroidales bacterium]